MENERYAEIVSSIADLSEHLGFTVLAEYVETAEQRDVLKTLGCSYFQGYLYAPALPFDEMVERARLTGTARRAKRGKADAARQTREGGGPWGRTCWC